MKMNVVVFRDTLVGCFTLPQFIQENPEDWAEGVSRSLKRADIKVLVKYKDLEAYELGTFDDVTGLFNLRVNPSKLVSFDVVCVPLIEKLREKEGAINA